MQKIMFIATIVLAICSASWCIYRDMQIEKQYTGDLRNRIVGARLQADGIPPYFYKWKKADGLRYYDPQNFDSLKVSNITATPSLHELLYPLADLPQRTISKLWLWIEYILFFAITIVFAVIATTNLQKIAVVAGALLFLYMNAWKSHIAAGQVYILFTFFFTLFFLFIRKRKTYLYAAPAGLCAAILFLIRPNAIVFLLPFLPLTGRSSFRYKMIFSLSALTMIVVALSSIDERLYWQDFRYAMAEQLKSHQALHPGTQHNEPDPAYTTWEGWDMQTVAKDAAAFPYSYNQEHGNVFVLMNHLLHIKTSVWLLSGLCLVAILVLLFFFFYLKSKAALCDLNSITLLAFLIYMITDLFSPIHRFLYYGVQWIFPLLIIASTFNKRYKWIYAGLATGLLLNSLNLTFIPMTQSLGEYIIFFFVVIYLFNYKTQTSV